jgi:hypothetical protein
MASDTDDNSRSSGRSQTDHPVLETARAYQQRGWCPIPLEGKRPTTQNWQNARYAETELESVFPDGHNVGVISGEASGGLVDIDLDCAEARSLASTFLPPTPAKFGRKSTPNSHRLYNVTPSSFKTERLADPDDEASNPGDHKGVLVELRGDRSQTMMPPSFHPSGEVVQWASDFSAISPATVSLEDLRRGVRKLAAASLLARRWPKLPRHDATLALTGALLQGRLTVEETRQFVLAVADDDEPVDRQRAVEDTIKKFDAGLPVAGAAKCRELFGDRAWAKVVEWLDLRYGDDWEPVDPSILSDHKHPAPPLPAEVFGARWGSWLIEQAAFKSAPVDYVAAPLLSAAASLIGNSRHVSAWEGFEQPPILWTVRVGNPSSGKSPAADPVHEIVHELEKELVEGHTEELRLWEQNFELAKAERAAWDAKVKASFKEGGLPPGELPASAQEPERPRYPHLTMTDATIEVLGYNQAGLPKGFQLQSDELSGWLGSFGRYNKGKSGSDTAFWLGAYDGRSHKVDRVHHKEKPYTIAHLSVSIDGGIQPDKLTSLLLDGDDDGLAARLLPFWPDPVRLERPAAAPVSSPVLDAMRKLRDLSMESHRVLRLTEPAAQRFQDWRVTNAEAAGGTSGMFQGWLGKLPGVVLRLSLVLRYLHWCAEESYPEEPKDIDVDTIAASIKLVDDYFVPMARRVFGDAAKPEPERDATAIARLILGRKIGTERAGRYIVNARTDVQRRGINRIRTANQARCALDELREAGWVRPAAPSAAGRPRGDYEVNPEALKLEAPNMRRDRANRPANAPWRGRKPKF